MTWVLKVREPETGFLGTDDTGHPQISAKASTAGPFDSQEEAEAYRDKMDTAALAKAWNSRAPQLLPVQFGAKSFIVPAWARVFHFLGCVSFFWVTRRLFPRLIQPYTFVEWWVLSWGALALASLLIVSWWHSAPTFLALALSIFGGLRVAEIVIYQINVLLLDEWRTKRDPKRPPYAVRSYRRLVILTIHNYVETLVWFAAFYVIEAARFHTAPDGLSLTSVGGAFYHSMLTMTTLGYGDIYPLTGEWIAAFLAAAQTLIGVFLAVVVLARVVALVPRPLTMDEDEAA